MYIKKSVTVGETAEILLQEKIKKKKKTTYDIKRD